MTEKEKMLTGALYDPGDPELTALRQRAQQQDINLMGTELSTYDTAAALKQLL